MASRDSDPMVATRRGGGDDPAGPGCRAVIHPAGRLVSPVRGQPCASPGGAHQPADTRCPRAVCCGCGAVSAVVAVRGRRGRVSPRRISFCAGHQAIVRPEQGGRPRLPERPPHDDDSRWLGCSSWWPAVRCGRCSSQSGTSHSRWSAWASRSTTSPTPSVAYCWAHRSCASRRWSPEGLDTCQPCCDRTSQAMTNIRP